MDYGEGAERWGWSRTPQPADGEPTASSSKSYVLDVAFDPTSTRIAVGQMPDSITLTPVPSAPQYTLLLWSPDHNEAPIPLQEPGTEPWTATANDVAFSTDGTRLFATHQQGIQVWDVTSRQC
jgi:uncharacterized protein with WD repeat